MNIEVLKTFFDPPIAYLFYAFLGKNQGRKFIVL